MVWTTDCPDLLASFIQEITMSKIEEELRDFEKFHGEMEEINVVFFRRTVPNECPKRLPKDSSNYTSCESFQFFDKQENRAWERRQLLVRLK